MAFVWAKALPSEGARNEAQIWGLRCYKLMFATFGLLIVSTFVPDPLPIVLRSLSVLGVGAVVFCLIRSYGSLARSRRLKRSGQ
jgi:hypothetical protein